MPLTPGRNQPKNDLVYTPWILAREIIEHFPLSGRVLDPARGQGSFFQQLPKETTNLWCEIGEGSDFYDFHEPVDWMITNPPWSHMRKWLAHSFTIAPDIVLLCTMTHFCTKARLRDLVVHGYALKEFYCVPTPKENWPQSGFQLGAMHIQKGYRGALDITGHIGE